MLHSPSPYAPCKTRASVAAALWARVVSQKPMSKKKPGSQGKTRNSKRPPASSSVPPSARPSNAPASVSPKSVAPPVSNDPSLAPIAAVQAAVDAALPEAAAAGEIAVPGAVLVDAVVVEPYGAHPSYVQGAYDRDNRFYLDWDPITRDEDAVQAWLREWVYDLDGRTAYLEKLGAERMASLLPSAAAPSGSVDYGAYR